ncbi:MAG: hypothetical protein HYY18_10900 [Planctomycetes bacterium]|nr:hypothetical protein [Planctomycetota bacterium]
MPQGETAGEPLSPPPPRRRRWRRRLLTIGLPALVALYLLLLIPDSVPTPPRLAKDPFAWNQDDRWKALEERFLASRLEAPEARRRAIGEALGDLRSQVARLGQGAVPADDPLLDRIEDDLFSLAARVGASPENLAAFLELANAVRDAVKEQSVRWDLQSPATRARLYRLLYGGRAAVEEAMLQAPPSAVPALTLCRDEPSPAPGATVLGVRLHSGDILLSRGAAPTSSLIARGNDFPGNFSHVALVHVDAATSRVSVVEAHIEKGVAVATIDEYLRDIKLRVMVLRLRSDLPALLAKPGIAEAAAAAALADARARHAPYDFAMDGKDHSKVFCSEVASAAYEREGVRLWMGMSTISSPGLCAWLAAFGVENFVTQEPSDLEYDRQLRVVAEWRDPEALLQDHVDNAVTDVLLEGAERGERLGYAWPRLPIARALKAWSCGLNVFGGVGPIPEGMSASAALRSEELRTRHEALRARLLGRVASFRAERGYTPPYWELVRLAREAASAK